MTEKTIHRRRFEEALMDELARLEREGAERIDRSRIEEIGQRFDLDPEEARRLFIASRGDIWQGELVESDEEPGWQAAIIHNVPSTGGSTSGEGI